MYVGTSGEVQGLAYDWLAGILYWTDEVYNWIMVAAVVQSTYAGRQPLKTRVVISTGLDRPAGLAVYPSKGYAYCGIYSVINL